LNSIVEGATTGTVTTRLEHEKTRGPTDAAPLRGSEAELRNLWLGLVPEVRDKDLFIPASGGFLGRIVKLYLLDAETGEQGPYFGYVIQRQNKFTANLDKPFRQLLEVSLAEIMVIELLAPVGRVQVEESRRTVKAPKDLLIGRALHLHSFQSFVGFFNELGQTFKVETRRLNHVAMVDGLPDETGEAIPQDIEMPCRPLNVC